MIVRCGTPLPLPDTDLHAGLRPKNAIIGLRADVIELSFNKAAQAGADRDIELWPMNLMGLYSKIFRPWPPIRDTGALADFIDEQAAFLAQKGIYEYSRARAGHYSKVLFREQGFRDAVERSRWQAYPLGLAMVAELAEGVLSAQGSFERRAVLLPLSRTVLSVFDRYPVPPAVGEQAWSAARAELARRLDLIGLHPPKRAMDIPEPFADSYFALMPIHKKLRASDYPTIKSYLKVTLCNIHDELTKRLDAEAITGALRLAEDDTASNATG
jgi:hypothetical protein